MRSLSTFTIFLKVYTYECQEFFSHFSFINDQRATYERGFQAVSAEEFFITSQSHHRKSRLPEGSSFSCLFVYCNAPLLFCDGLFTVFTSEMRLILLANIFFYSPFLMWSGHILLKVALFLCRLNIPVTGVFHKWTEIWYTRHIAVISVKIKWRDWNLSDFTDVETSETHRWSDAARWESPARHC